MQLNKGDLSMIMDLYSLVRDLINEAREQKNLALVEKLIDIKLAISDLQDENKELKDKLEIKDEVVRHTEGNYITLKNDSLQIKYCATCWGNDQKLIQLCENDNYPSGFPQCPNCLATFLKARNKGQ